MERSHQKKMQVAYLDQQEQPSIPSTGRKTKQKKN
jgi:hypothetical protein